MADTKISALPASTTPLAGTEVLPIVQGGVTRQVSVANLTAGRAVSAASVTASTGNFVVGTSGQGIDFSATPGTGTSELLSDYEEGTWTPAFTNLTVVNGTGGATYTGTYTRVGRLVYFTATITVTGSCTTASVNGSTSVSLPFTAVPLAGSVGVADANAANLSNGLIAGAVCYMPTWSARNVAIYVGGTFSV
jgi:hypothetical protein